MLSMILVRIEIKENQIYVLIEINAELEKKLCVLFCPYDFPLLFMLGITTQSIQAIKY